MKYEDGTPEEFIPTPEYYEKERKLRELRTKVQAKYADKLLFYEEVIVSFHNKITEKYNVNDNLSPDKCRLFQVLMDGSIALCTFDDFPGDDSVLKYMEDQNADIVLEFLDLRRRISGLLPKHEFISKIAPERANFLKDNYHDFGKYKMYHFLVGGGDREGKYEHDDFPGDDSVIGFMRNLAAELEKPKS